MKIDTNNYPSNKKVKEAIERLSNHDWPSYEENHDIDKLVESVSQKITSELNIFPSYFLQLKPSNFPFGIFRVRPVNSFMNIDLFSEHSYPPSNIVKLGRCNFPKHPVFYSSNNPITALAEVIRENDFQFKKYCISSWEIIPTDEIFIFESFLQSDLPPKNQFGLLAKSFAERLNEPFKGQLSKDKLSGLLNFFKFIDNQFIKDKNYSFSACLAHRRIYANHNYCTDILMYPSVQTEKLGVNLAINPNFVNNHMRIKRFYIVEVDNYDRISGKFSMSFYKYGEILKNTLFWREIVPEDNNYKKYFEEDFSDYIDKNHVYNFEKI